MAIAAKGGACPCQRCQGAAWTRAGVDQALAGLAGAGREQIPAAAGQLADAARLDAQLGRAHALRPA